jgi:eukaryotic-like serine/threonine-protein kinase
MLGKSMRRRRGRGPGPGSPLETGTGPSLQVVGKVALIAAAAVLLGWGTGYLYATHVAFPGPEIHVAEYAEVPGLLGLELAEARELLAERGLEMGAVDSIHHPEAGRGRILGQSPLPGQLGIPGGEVELTISLGPEERPIPDVTRLRADRALTVLQTTGFQVMVDSTEAWMAPGRVVETEPRAGSMLTLPGEVRMTVSLGPPMVTMPNLVGLQEERARMLLDSLGLVVGEVETAFRFGFNQGEVLEHFPRPDSLIARGEEVRLVIGRRGFFRDGDDEGDDGEIPQSGTTEVPEARDENRTDR